MLIIFSKLSLSELLTASQVNKQWQAVANNNSFWKLAMLQRYPHLVALKMMKIRPMGVCKHLYNSLPLEWGKKIPSLGAYLWKISIQPQSKSQDKLNMLMGVAKPSILFGVKSISKEKTQSNSSILRSSSNTSISTSKIFFKVNLMEYETIFFLMDCILQQFTLLLPQHQDKSLQLLSWKKFQFPKNNNSLTTFCELHSTSNVLITCDSVDNKRVTIKL